MSLDVAHSKKFSLMSVVAAILVVCHHFASPGEAYSAVWWLGAIMGQTGSGMSGGLSWIAVPWFFLASGYLLAGHMGEDAWWHREVGKRVKSLIVPFFIWSLVAIAYLTIFDVIQGRSLFFNSIERVLFALGVYPCRVVSPLTSQLWYVRCLFALVLISPILYNLSSKKFLVLLAIVYAIVAPFDNAVLHIFFRYGFSLEGLFFFSLGIYLRHNPIKVRYEKAIGAAMMVSGVFLVVVRAVFAVKGIVLFEYLDWIATLLMLGGTWFLMPTFVLPSFLAGISFPIYLMHRFAFLLFSGFCRKISWGGGMTLWLAYFMVGVGVPICVALLMRHFLPKLSRVLFGGR